MTTLQNVAWEPCLVEPRPDRTLEALARRKLGIPFPAIRYLTPVPWLARAVIDLPPDFGLLMKLDPKMADLIALVVSQENSCRFCYAAVRALLWAQGWSETRIDRVHQGLARAEASSGTAAMIAFARSQSRIGPAGAREAAEALRKTEFSQEEIKEIAYVVGKTDFTNRVFTILAVPPQPWERLPSQLHMRLLRPLLRRIIERHRYRGQITQLRRAPPYPFSQLIEAYSGSPIGAALATTIDQMWESTILPRRCKLLMIAVVTRGLGCGICAPEISESLKELGLDEPRTEKILTHLDGPELEQMERHLLAFARETIWYEPHAVQRRAGALRRELSGPQLVEAVGVLALANGLCRMGATVAHA